MQLILMPGCTVTHRTFTPKLQFNDALLEYASALLQADHIDACDAHLADLLREHARIEGELLPDGWVRVERLGDGFILPDERGEALVALAA